MASGRRRNVLASHVGQESFSQAGPISGRGTSHNGPGRIPPLVRPDSKTRELKNGADTLQENMKTVGREEEYEMPPDSGGAAASGEGVRGGDNLSQRDANGEESVVIEDSREDDDIEKEEEEGREPKTMRMPKQVSKEERDAHEATHMPFRSWCRHCVRGRARNMQHTKEKAEVENKNKVPRVSMDYFFMSEEDRKASTNPLFIMIDEETKDRYARAVGKKGVTDMDWLVKDIVAELRAWGHQGGEGGVMIMKSDNENSIVAVREAAGKFLGGRVIPEAPAKGESKSNGEIEEAGKTVREFAVVLKDMIEHKANIKIEQDDIIVPWMVRWSAMMISRYMVGKDGKTGYERRRGRRCKIPVVPFGETVWYKQVRENKDRKDKFNSEWEEGVWLGHARNSNEAVIGLSDGVVRAYAIKRQDEGNRWQPEKIKGIRGTPSQPDPNKPGLYIPVRVRFDPVLADIPVEQVQETEVRTRRERITKRTLNKYGYTAGCDGCLYKDAGLNESKHHTEACRKRIDELRQRDRDQGLPDAEDEGQDKGDGGEPEVVWWKPKPPEEAREDEELEEELDEAHPGKWWRSQEDDQQEMQADDEDLKCPESDHEEPTLGRGGGGMTSKRSEIELDPNLTKGVKRQVEQVEYKIVHEKRRREQAQEAEKRKMEQKEKAEVKRYKVQQREVEKRKREKQENEEKAEKKQREENQQQVPLDDSDMDVEGEIAAALYKVSSPDAKCEDLATLLERTSIKFDGRSGPGCRFPDQKTSKSPDVTEFYSPPRVIEEAIKWGLTPGMAFDLTTGWDFRRERDRQQARAYVKEKKPKIVIGSPMCTMFSSLQRLSGWDDKKQVKWCEAKEHIKFMVEIYKIQTQEGRWFLHGHPASASS